MNEFKWNLQELFTDEESFYKEIENVKVMLNDIKKYENTKLNSKSLLNMLDEKWNIKEKTNNILVYGSLMYYKNINNEKCINLKNIAEAFNNDVNDELKFIDKKILSLGSKKVSHFIKEEPKLNLYELLINNLFRSEKHVQSDEINKQIKENNNLINEQLNIYNNLLRDTKYGSIKVDGEDIEIKQANFAKYISDENREIRKETYLTVNSSFEKEKNNFASILNKIYGYRILNSNLEKYSSVLEKTLFEENINPLIINKLIKSVNDNLNIIQKYLKIKTDLLNIKTPHLYDFGVPINSNLKIEYSLDEAKEIILKALKPLGQKYINVVKKLFNGHIDAELDENKHQSITFSWNTYSFMNFRGAYIDLKNMIHEIGHIVNYYLSKEKQPFMYEDSTIFVGETASIVNEILLNRYLYQNAKTKDEKIFYLSKEIENYFSSVFKQTMYTELENDLYNIKKDSELTSEILCQKYLSIIKKYYGCNIAYDEIAGVEWTRLGHLYRWSYYPYKYATGLLIASVVVDSLIDKKTLTKEDYIKFLSSGSNKYSLDLLKMLNIDLLNTNIIESGFNVMSQDIKELEKVLFQNND
ncbi:MAG: M3 family metallopeptidase [bacterium]|nr:M3 family metallopeptidase [bacterium]